MRAKMTVGRVHWKTTVRKVAALAGNGDDGTPIWEEIIIAVKYAQKRPLEVPHFDGSLFGGTLMARAGNRSL